MGFKVIVILFRNGHQNRNMFSLIALFFINTIVFIIFINFLFIFKYFF